MIRWIIINELRRIRRLARLLITTDVNPNYLLCWKIENNPTKTRRRHVPSSPVIHCGNRRRHRSSTSSCHPATAIRMILTDVFIINRGLFTPRAINLTNL